MPTPPDDRFIITANRRTTGVVMTIGEVEVAVKMPTALGFEDMSEEQVRQAALRQLKRILEVAHGELG